MARSNDDYRKVRMSFDEKRRRAEDKAYAEKIRLYAEIKGLKEIDDALAKTAGRVMDEIRKGPLDIDKRICALRKDNEQLQRSREILLAAHGYSPDATEPKYECPICNDMGSIEGKACSCFKRALSEITLEKSGLGSLLKTQSFETFSLDYYKGADRKNAEKNLNACKDYAESFDLESSDNLTFMGGTGLGKTHLSTSIARVVISRGYDVVYETAQNIISGFEADKYARGDGSSKRFLECELLIADDLGAEAPGQNNVPFLYNLINDRMNTGKKTIISTNLSAAEIRSKYGDRILSRLMGEYIPLVFTGKDIRMQKLNG